MRITLLIGLALIVAALFYFRGSLVRFSKGLLQSDLNPQLVSALQGDWALTDDKQTVFRIKRDSLIEMHNDSVVGTNSLGYVFREAAADYFTKDSAFAFSTPGESQSSTKAFELRKIHSGSKDTINYTLAYVSKTQLDMISPSGRLHLNRIDEPILSK